MTVITDTTIAMPIAVPSSIQSAPGIAMPTSSTAKSTKPVVHKKKTWKKPADKPKRPLSAYNLFFQHERNRIVGESPAGADGNKRKHRKSHGKIGFESLAKTIANKWKTLDKASKRPFEQQAKREKAIYAQKLQAWHELRLARPSLEQILEQAYIVRPSPPAAPPKQTNMAPSPVTSTARVTPTPVTPPAQPQAAIQQVQLEQLPKPMPVQSTTPIAFKKLAAPDIMDLSNPKAFFEKTSLPVAPMDMSLTNLLGEGSTGGGDVGVLDSFDMPEIGAPSDDLSQMLNDDFIDFLSTMD